MQNRLSELCKATGINGTPADGQCHHVLGALMQGMRSGGALPKYANRDYSELLQEAGLPKHASDEMARLLREYDYHLHSAAGRKF
ncbi:MAG: hypothetical protein ACK502_02600 [Alphaproteobacteria bacterium]